MLISHTNKFIFTKTAKTGGTSIESYFEKFCMKEGEWSESHAREEYISETGVIGFRGGDRGNATWYNHMPAQDIKSIVGETLWQNYFKFSVVRNPYDKVISHFYFAHNGHSVLNAEPAAILKYFRQWVCSKKSVVDRDKYLINGRLEMDYLIRFEELEKGIREVCTQLNLPFKPEELPMFKKGIRPEHFTVEEMYDEESSEAVKKRYQWEFDNLGYPTL